MLKIDNPNITIEEYIRLQEEKALSQGETFNWQTATYGKMEYCEDEDDCFTNFETKFPAIVLDNTLTSDAAISCGPTHSVLTDHLIRRIHQLDTTYQTFLSGQRIEFHSLNGVSIFQAIRRILRTQYGVLAFNRPIQRIQTN
ncbi:hypothetical protein Tco_0686840 [Tanacetum coccineum]